MSSRPFVWTILIWAEPVAELVLFHIATAVGIGLYRQRIMNGILAPYSPPIMDEL